MTGVTLAVACAAAVAALMTTGGVGTVRETRAVSWRAAGTVAAPAAAVALALASREVAVLVVVGALLVLGGSRLVRRARDGRCADVTRVRVIELCDALCAELAAGQDATGALERAAADWAVVAPVARAAATGGDVTGGLRALADQPGAAALRVVAASWQVSHRTGHGLATTLGRVADDLRAAEQTRRVVAGELASARATARLLAVLPLMALAMASGSGASPWPFLLGHPAGLACLAGGLGLGYAGLSWVEALARDVDRSA